MPSHDVMPGIEALGCGFNPFNSTLTRYKPRLFEFDYTGDNQPYTDPRRAGTYKTADGKLHSIPRGVLVSPIPAEGESKAEVFESRRQVEEKFAANASIGGGYGLFRASFSASFQVDQSRTSEYSYATKQFDASFWTLSMAADGPKIDTNLTAQLKSAAANLPSTFPSGESREAWDTFFERFGTHYIAGCRVGGKCALSVAVQKNTKMTLEKISAQVDAEYGALIKGGGSTALERLDKTYVESHQHWESTRGGDPTLAGRLQENPEIFAKWLDSVKNNPGFTDFVLSGIWELIPQDNKREAVRAAFIDYCYRNSSYVLLVRGQHSYVDIMSQEGLNNFSQATFEAWIYPNGNGTGGSHGGIIVNKEGSFEVARFQDGTIQWAFKNIRPGWDWRPTGAKAALKEWTHIAVVYDSPAKKVTAYKDGNPCPPVSVEGAIAPTPSKLYIGARSGLEQNFDGYIEEVRIWNRPLTTEEIQRHMYRRFVGNEHGLVGLWTLNEATGDHVRDRSASGNHGILRNANWAEPPAASPITVASHSRVLATPAIKEAMAKPGKGPS